MLTAVVGINWGDEGKGRMVDLLSEGYDIICRYQGGNNAGHTVINERGKFVLNLLPSGILRATTVNVIGPGVVVDIEHLSGEINALTKQGVKITPDNLKISENAFICMPYHVKQDILEEKRLGDKKYGSTMRGIAPVYGDKYMKKGLRLGDLFHSDTLQEKIDGLVEWKNITLRGYNAEINLSDVIEWVKKHGKDIKPFITDTTDYLRKKADEGKNILFEAQLGALRDIEYGIYPFTTSSNTLAAYAPIGSGIPGVKLTNIIGVIKAYSSCVGEGPFTAEFFGEEAKRLRDAGSEIGAATGRPRRVGAFDVPASLYGIQMQGADELALTKLDVLSYCEKIPVCTAYEIGNKRTTQFPIGNELLDAKPVIEYLPGFMEDISKCRSISQLPQNALDYIRYIEDVVSCPIKYVSVGPGREDYIEKR